MGCEQEPTTSVFGMTYERAAVDDDQGDNGMSPPLSIDDAQDPALAISDRDAIAVANDTIAAVNRQNEELRARLRDIAAQQAAQASAQRPRGIAAGLVIQQRALLVDADGQGWWAVPDQCAILRAW